MGNHMDSTTMERIAGDLAEVSVLVLPGKSPATYSPAPDQIKKLAGADLYFRIGVPFENGFLHKIESIVPDIRVVDTRQGIVLRQMERHIHEGDSHGGHDHAHTDEGADPHIWMSPVRVKQQAATIRI